MCILSSNPSLTVPQPSTVQKPALSTNRLSILLAKLTDHLIWQYLHQLLYCTLTLTANVIDRMKCI